jgi:hypothetical protein
MRQGENMSSFEEIWTTEIASTDVPGLEVSLD